MRLIQDLRKHEFCPKLYSAALLFPPFHCYLITSDENQHLFFCNLKLIIFLSFSLLPQRPGCVPSLSQIPSFCYLIYLVQFAYLQLDKRTSFMSCLIYFKLIFTKKLSHTFLLKRKGEIKNQNSGLVINLFPIS